MYPFFSNGRWTSYRVLGDAVDRSSPITPKRVDAWVQTDIHVAGRPEWVIVKTHTHGATDADNVLGQTMQYVFQHLSEQYNDGQRFVLHYVTARELYNIIKAVEAGEDGDNPHAYRDYRITPPCFDPAVTISEASTRLRELVAYSYDA